jgi:hypothetical protein
MSTNTRKQLGFRRQQLVANNSDRQLVDLMAANQAAGGSHGVEMQV